MSETEPYDVDAVPDAEPDAEPYAEPDASSDQQADGKKRKLSAMYDTWGFYQSGWRAKSHRGAQCIACANHLKKHKKALSEKGTCGAEIQAILAHVKQCDHQPRSARAAASAELKELRIKRKPADKRPISALAAGGTEGSSGSSHGLEKFMAWQEPMSPQEQKKFEQHCLKGTISANLPFSCWDDNEFRQMFTSLRPAIKLPSRKTLSTRIFDAGAAVAWEELSKILRESDGRPAALASKSYSQVVSPFVHCKLTRQWQCRLLHSH